MDNQFAALVSNHKTEEAAVIVAFNYFFSNLALQV